MEAASVAPGTPAAQIPFVDYLVLADPPYLVARECTACAARFFGRRNACANCSGSDFAEARVRQEGEVRAFTIVNFASPGIPVPFVAAIIDCAGTSVRANLINVNPDPRNVTLGMKVRLATYAMGVDQKGTEAVGFGFEPLANPA